MIIKVCPKGTWRAHKKVQFVRWLPLHNLQKGYKYLKCLFKKISEYETQENKHYEILTDMLLILA